ncbi:serine/threonine-protein kinase STY13-like [Camellia sinensis]|uniref:serine/threonine-protein kinase STY13-like n=1 Tax=Camellia sinensis TaxID=4442 RepID=UPI0010368850|nr:serine/threonine-protein kinase STY13-like [Camellia sinensis]
MEPGHGQTAAAYCGRGQVEIEDEEDDEDLTPRIGMDSDDDDNSEQRFIRQALGSIPSMPKHLRSPKHNGTTLSLVFDSTEMDLKIGGGDSNTQEGELGLKEKDVGSISSKDMFFRADKIDFQSWDLQLEKHLSWGEDGIATAAETVALRVSFRQEVAVWHKRDHPNVTKFIGASMGTSNLKISSDNTSSDAHNSLPSRACGVVVEYLPGGTLKKYLIRNWRKKLALGVVIQLALDLSRGLSYLHSSRTLLEPYFVDLK